MLPGLAFFSYVRHDMSIPQSTKSNLLRRPWRNRGVFQRQSPADLRSNEQRIWDELGTRSNERTLVSLRTILIGFDNTAREDLTSHVSELGMGLTAAIGDPGALELCPEILGEFNIVVVNFDAFQDVDDGVDKLLMFRQQHPFPAVVLLSSKVSCDDLGDHRRAICDATLALPLSQQRLVCGMRTALENHNVSI
jgi:hypothetical protein